MTLVHPDSPRLRERTEVTHARCQRPFELVGFLRHDGAPAVAGITHEAIRLERVDTDDAA
jgi:hypothetical protein